LTKQAFLSGFRNGSSLILMCHLGCSDYCFFRCVCPGPAPTCVSANLYFGLLFSCDFFFWLFGREYLTAFVPDPYV